MLRNDILMRLSEQIGKGLLRVIELKERGNYDEALEELQKTGELYLGMNSKVLDSSSDDLLITLLNAGGNFDFIKCILLAELLQYYGEIYTLQNESGKSYSCYTKALSLFLEAILSNEKARIEDYTPAIDSLINELDKYEQPTHIKFKSFLYYERTGKYSKAEDLLFELIELEEPGVIRAGISFYERLLSKTDEELIEGNLPRDEVEDSLMELQERDSEIDHEELEEHEEHEDLY
jgi:tetratricopeptide (TPR) repeat protein